MPRCWQSWRHRRRSGKENSHPANALMEIPQLPSGLVPSRASAYMRYWWTRIMDRIGLREWDEGAVLLVLGALIGVAVGLGVVAFYKLIDLAYLVFHRIPEGRLPQVAAAIYHPMLTAAGIWLAWAIVRVSKLPDGQNVPDMQRAVAKEGGRIPARRVTIRTVAAAVTLGSGGTAGSEGPVATLGGGLGSAIGRIFRLSSRHRRVIVGCGAAAGISGAFGAPFAGAFFALEEVLGTLAGSAFSPVVIACVAGSFEIRPFLGSAPVVAVPAAPEFEWWAVVFLFPLLGIACGALSAAYTRVFFSTSDMMGRLPGPAWLRPVLGGAVVGALALVAVGALTGDGHLRIPMQVFGGEAWWFLLLIAAVKIVMTSLTLGSGGSGGVFTPTLFIGAAFGGGVGMLLHDLLPLLDIRPESFGLVGMAGLVAGATRAPLTAIFMVFEITDDYELILPLMIVSVLAFYTSRRMSPYGLYDGWLIRRGEHIAQGADRALMERVHVSEAMTRNPVTVAPDATMTQIFTASERARSMVLPVVDQEGKLAGLISHTELRDAMLDRGSLANVLMAMDLAGPAISVSPDDTLRTALRTMNARAMDVMPVVSAKGVGAGRLVGMLSRADLLDAYERALVEEV